MKLRFFLIFLLGILNLPFAAQALQPYLVADIDPTLRSGGSAPANFARLGSRVLLTANTSTLGLWISDGTAAGTARLLANQISFRYLANTGQIVLFEACGTQGCRLWATDGTLTGTRALPASIPPSIPWSKQAASAGERRVFFTGTGGSGPELWTSDGTPAGTRLVKRFVPRPSATFLYDLAWFRDRLWFFFGEELWTSDGTAVGTRKIAAVGWSNQSSVAGSKFIFFAAPIGTSNYRLWASDGTAQGTKIFSAIPTIFQSVPLDPFAVVGGNTFLTGQAQLWITDGTPTHTRRLPGLFGLRQLVAVGSKVAFINEEAGHGAELWVSDGRKEGTRRLEVCPGPCSGTMDIEAVDGGRVWFAGNTANEGEELWISDLTVPGTRMVKALVPGGQSISPRNFVAGDGRVFFAAGSGSGDELWASDGTAAGTRRLVQRGLDDPQLDLSLGVGVFVNGRLFFRLADKDHGAEPWISDGTLAGTKLISDLATAQDSGSHPRALMPAGNRCFFFATSGNEDSYGLWVSDGTSAGTSLAHDFETPFYSPHGFIGADLGGRLAWYHQVGSALGEIWSSDGTLQGTSRLHWRPNGELRAVAGRLYFEAFDPDHGDELWTSDGTPEGTIRLSDLPNPSPFPGPVRSPWHGLVELSGGVAFLAADALGTFEPWYSDGSIGGTRRLADAYPALDAPFTELASEVVSVGGRIFFVSGTASPSLWVSDLTAVGTKSLGPLTTRSGAPAALVGLAALSGRVLVFYRGPQESGFWSSDGTTLSPGGLYGLDPRAVPEPWGGRLVYRAEDDTLYSTDGTEAGTTRLTYPDGSTVENVQSYTVLGGHLAFATALGIWDTDGTAAGTVRRLRTPGNGNFVRAGERIFFPRYDAETGTELWALRP